MKKLIGALALSLAAANANAGLMDVSYIQVTNALGTWLQIAEIWAVDMSITNVALTGTATSNEAGGTYFTSPTLVNDGDLTGTYPNIFHEGAPTSNGAMVTLTLAAPTELAGFAIFGRTDCCSDRDVYNVEFFNESDESLYYAASLDATGERHAAFIEFGPSSQVPVPASVGLIGLGLLGLAARKKRQA